MFNKGIKCSVSILVCSALLAAPAAAQTGTVTSDLLNVRTAPSTGSPAVSMLSWGDTVDITYDCGGWYEIYQGGGCYYVCSDYVSTGGSYSSSSASYASGNSYSDYSYTDDYSNSGSGYYEESYQESYEEPATQGTYLGNFAITGYCGCEICCGRAGAPTASGVMPTPGHTVAMGGVDFGTKLLINGTVYTVEDRGTPYGTVDIFCSSHEEASAVGLQYADVYQVG